MNSTRPGCIATIVVQHLEGNQPSWDIQVSHTLQQGQPQSYLPTLTPQQGAILVGAFDQAAADLGVYYPEFMYTFRASAGVVITLFVSDWLAVAIGHAEDRYSLV